MEYKALYVDSETHEKVKESAKKKGKKISSEAKDLIDKALKNEVK